MYQPIRIINNYSYFYHPRLSNFNLKNYPAIATSDSGVGKITQAKKKEKKRN